MTAMADPLAGSFFYADTAPWRQWPHCGFTPDDDAGGGIRGRVVAAVVTGIYLVQMYNWTTGLPYPLVLTRVEDMMAWEFFNSARRLMEYTRPLGRIRPSPLMMLAAS